MNSTRLYSMVGSASLFVGDVGVCREGMGKKVDFVLYPWRSMMQIEEESAPAISWHLNDCLAIDSILMFCNLRCIESTVNNSNDLVFSLFPTTAILKTALFLWALGGNLMARRLMDEGQGKT